MCIAIISSGDVAIIPLDWSDLPTGVTIGQVTHTVPSPLTKVAEASDEDEKVSQVKVSGAVHGGMYVITASTTLTNGEVVNRQVPVRCFNG